MPSKKKPNQFARVIAVFALIAAVILVIATIASSGGDSDSDGDSGPTTVAKGQTKKGEHAVERGVWIVDEGDTLVSISEETGVDLDELVSLNPDIDPQTLSTGQRVSLREGLAGQDGGSSSSDSSSAGTTTNSGDPAAEFGDGSVADGQSGDSTTP